MDGSGTNIPLSDHKTQEVLHLAVVRDLRTIDRLLDALALPEQGPTLLRRLTGDDATITPASLARMSPGELASSKQLGKRLVATAQTEHDRMCGSWRYIVAVAAALAYHGRLLSSSGGPELRPIFLDLADLTPPPWTDLFEAAASRCSLGEDRARRTGAAP